MKLLIEISEESYNRIKDVCAVDRRYVPIGWVSIANGIPIPKGHGRLIDADALPLNDIDDANYGSNYIRIAPTIIEADKEKDDDK